MIDLDVQIQGGLPKANLPEQTAVFKKIEEYMVQSIQKNFLEGGRPAWQPKKDGTSFSLGRLFRSISGISGANYASVSAAAFSKTGYNYGLAQNFGAKIPPVEGKLMVFEIDGHIIFTYKRKGFDLPARAFMMFQDEDVDYILRSLSQAVFEGTKSTL